MYPLEKIIKSINYRKNTIIKKICYCADQINGHRITPEKTLVINGFWRSGTTWVQEIAAEVLNSKIIFEPFEGSNKHFQDCLPEIKPCSTDLKFTNAIMPFVEREFIEGSLLHYTVKLALKGQLSDFFFTRENRERSLSNSFKPSVVVKFTRGALCLKAIANTFKSPIIHITRDPRAVIASIKKPNPKWGKSAFQNFPLKKHLLETEDGRRNYFQNWANDIEAIEKTNDFGRLAAYHCLTEMYVQKSFVGVERNCFQHLRYENLAIKKCSNFNKILKTLGLSPQVSIAKKIDRPSSADRYDTLEKVPVEKRLFAWKSKLTSHERGIIEDVVKSFNMDHLLWD